MSNTPTLSSTVLMSLTNSAVLTFEQHDISWVMGSASNGTVRLHAEHDNFIPDNPLRLIGGHTLTIIGCVDVNNSFADLIQADAVLVAEDPCLNNAALINTSSVCHASSEVITAFVQDWADQIVQQER